MSKYNLVNQAKLVVIAAIALLCAALSGHPRLETQQPDNRVEIVGMEVPAAQRPGSDDGAAFAVHFVGETRGSLEPCG